jgi:hypothetical protein
MIERAQRSPAWSHIADGFMLLARSGVGREDPAVVRRVIERGEEMYLSAQQARPLRERAHEPIVYYFRLGNLIKIGTSRNVFARINDLNPQAVLAIERGGYADEADRHRLFADLRVHGEWFRDADPLSSYVRAVAAGFDGDFGCPLGQWLAARGVAQRPEVDMIDSQVYS